MHLVGGLHMGEMTRGGRVYLLVDGATCVLVDTGAPDGTLGAGQLIEAAHRRSHEVRLVLLTHAHPAHAGNAAAMRVLTGAPVACSLEVAAALADPPPPGRRGPLRRLLGDDVVAPLRNPRIIEPGERLDIAGGIEVLDAAGHAPGHLAFHLVGPGALCVGDAAALDHGTMVPPPRRWCADWEAALATVGRLAEVPARLVAPGHGTPSLHGHSPDVTRVDWSDRRRFWRALRGRPEID